MKKLTLFLVAMFAMVNIANAQRAWAYDLGLSPSGDSYEFTFKAVTAANATLVFYQDGIEAGTLNLGAVTAGQNTVTKTSDELLSTIQKSGDFTWGVTMTGSAIASFVELTKDSNTDFHFWMPTGVAVDNNPESPYFSRFYIASPRSGKMTEGGGNGIQHNAGVYVFDQTLTLLNETKQTGYVPSNVTVSGSDYFELHRIAVNPTNNQVAFSQKTASIAAIWSMNPASMKSAAENLISGTAITDANSCCFDKDGVLYVANTSTKSIYKVKDGVATIFVTTSELAQPRNAIASDGRGGLWIAQYRGQDITVDGTARLMHIDSEGTLDYKVDSDTPHGFTGTAQRGAVAYNIKEDILAFGANKYGNLYKVTYDAETGDPSLESIGKTPSIATNIDGLAFDYAGDLYVTTASIERLFKYAVPTNNNTCTTPAPKAQTITLVAPSITLNAHPVKDYSASIVGTMKRAIQNGENTIVLTHEDNGTPHIYSIEHSTKTVTEISQEGVHAAADGFLSISDIAVTEDGKLVACNSAKCSFTPSGTNYFYIWNNLSGNPEEWFTSQSSANYTNATVGGTMALKGISSNAEVFVLAVTTGATKAARYIYHTVNNGTPTTIRNHGADNMSYLAVGTTYELNASPLSNTNWIIDGELIAPMEFEKTSNATAISKTTSLDINTLGKKFNGASYLFHNDHHLMVAPYADGDGKLAGVKVLDITNGFAAAIQIITSTDLTSAISATAAAATAYVDGAGELTIYLFADSKVYAFSEKEYTAATYTVTATAGEGGTVEGGGTYDEGATATLTATPAEHYEFVNWTEGGEVVSTTAEYSFTVTEDVELIANFAKKQYTLTVFVNDENKGTIDVATGSYEYGTEVTLTATPKPDHKLLAWSNKATTPSITLTMDNNKAVSAYFVKEYATDPTFTIEKVWENTHVPASTNNGFQGVGWDRKIYVKDRLNQRINIYTETDSTLYVQLGETVTGLAGDQPIAVDEAGNIIVRSGSGEFHTSPVQVTIFEKDKTTPKTIDFTLPATGRCDFITASGDIFSEKGGYVYFFCMGQTTISRLFIKNGEYAGVDTIGTITKAAASQSNVVLDIYGNIHTQSKNAGAFEYNITTLTSTADPYLGAVNKQTPNSTIGGCTFELGGKEFWAYVDGKTNFSSEWQLINATDGKLVSEEILFAKDKTSKNTAANWLNVQVVDEKTAYIYQFCPTVAAAVWKVSFKENYTVSATANPVAGGIVTGAGTYQEGATATLTATPNTGYKFVNWTKGGEVVSTDATYSFPVTENVELVANFEAITSKDPRAWAYDMKLGEDGDNYTFTFKATTAGQATISFKDKDGNALTQPESQTMTAGAGENKFTIAKNAFAAGVDAFWSITMDGAPIEGVVEVTDQSRRIYDFYNMMGVVVDNNTDSKDFGKIYVQASLNGKSGGITDRAKAQKAGIFIYNQDLDELNDPSNTGYKPIVPSGYTEIGSSSSAFQRLNIHPKTGNLVYSHAIEGQPAVFAINREDMTGAVTNLLTGVADMTRSVAHCFDAEGMLYVMDFAEEEGTVYKVINGEATPFTATSDKFINAYITIVSDGRGGLWISQNRGQFDAEPYPAYYQLAHVTSTGEFDWVVNRDTPHGLEGSSSRGALAYDVERKILAQGRNGKVELYTVSYEPTITLTPLHTIASNDLGTNIDGLAFDYAGDLYVVNSLKEKFQKFTLPTDENICTVAAPALEAIRFTPVYTVSVESNNNEWGIVSGGGTFEEGQSTTITAVPATNYKFVNWTKGGAEVSTENPYAFAVTESATYVANFKEITKYTINVTYDNTMGTVTGDGSYYEGTEVTLTATAKGGYVFVDWSDGNTDETRTFTAGVDMPETLTANFKVAVPRAWAYDLRKGEDGDNYTFTFKTTSAGTATLIFKDKDGNTQDFGAHTATATEAGEQKITIAKSTFDAATKDIYWEVKMEGALIEKMAEITNPARNIYDFYNMMGVVVDNDPNSDEFGKIYIQQSYNGADDGIADRSDTQKAGIFIYNQALEELNAPANTGIKPQLPYTIGANRQVFKRITINPTNGHIAFCNNTTTNGGAYSVSRETLTGEAVNLTKHIAEIQKVNALCFDDEGNLYVVANVTGSGAIYKIEEDGNYTKLTLNGENLFVDQEIAMTTDGHGGLWIAQNRWGVVAGALFHVNVAEDKIDFKVEADKDYSDWFAGANYRGAIAYDKQRDILAVHSEKRVSVFHVTYAADGVPSISKICQTPNIGMYEFDGLAFDYAGDLYVVNSGTERFYKYVLPTNDNTCTVPAPESQFIQKETRYTVTVEVNNPTMGTAIGGGTDFLAGDIATLSATANDGYQFVNWTKDGVEVSIEASYTFTVTEDVELVANFKEIPAPRAITYELNGGQYNQYGWENKGDICLALEADYNATYGTSKNWVQKVDGVILYNINGTWMTEEEAKGQEATVVGFIQNVTFNEANNLTTLIESTMVDKYGWLKDVFEANRAAQSLTTTWSENLYRKELSAFFLHSPAHNTGWPASSSYEEAGELITYQAYWDQSFPNPTHPNSTVTLNAPYKEGYLFKGWYEAPDFSGAEITVVDETTNGTLYAKWLEHFYTRDVTNGRYGTICLPYGSTNMTGATFYEVAWMNTAVNPWQVYVDQVTELEAGKPYIFLPTSSQIKVVYQGKEADEAGDYNGLYGTFDEIIDGEAGAAGNVLENNHMLSNNQIMKCLGKCQLPANRAYFKLDEIRTTEPSLVPGRRRVALGVQGGNEATGVDNLTEDGPIAPNVEGTYDVLGRKFTEPNGTGFYIVNGKKVVIVK